MSKKKTPIKIIGERDISLNLANKSHQEKIVKIGKALSVPARIQILNILRYKPLSLQEISSILDIPISSIASHIKYLEDAKLVVTESQPGVRGSMRVCITSLQTFHLDASAPLSQEIAKPITVDMPVGSYYKCKVEPTCGLAGIQGPLDSYDSPLSFYSPKRMEAQLLWFHKGYIEYRFPNLSNSLLDLHEISFTMELCSEAPGYSEEWPSDISISINNQYIGTYRSPGDFGSRRGKLTPESWEIGKTQYGLLKTFSVRKDGSFIDGIRTEINTAIKDLDIQSSPYISLLIEIKSDAECIGGINLFGEKYGDYPQGITMSIIY
ncbi:ArsR/SmtB family transcription factor [Alloiococcus sp. CFN-8]|uniref:ArsR/SmtB family transcription factor n=1 Tax=Alloiococcus sp. CFN-8 TaxID=3416081 RepID=UPI003CF93868